MINILNGIGLTFKQVPHLAAIFISCDLKIFLKELAKFSKLLFN